MRVARRIVGEDEIKRLCLNVSSEDTSAFSTRTVIKS